MTRLELKMYAKSILEKKYWPFFVLALISTAGSFAAAVIGMGIGTIFFAPPFRAAYCNCLVVNSKNGDEMNKDALWKNFRENYKSLLKNTFIRDLLLALWSLPLYIGMGVFIYGMYMIVLALAIPVLITMIMFLTIFLIPFIPDVMAGFDPLSTSAITSSLPFVGIGFVVMVIGGIIYYRKKYSYYMTDFIIGENPDISWREAVKQSKKMMHKKKFFAFKLDLSFIGWYIVVSCVSAFLSPLTGPFSIILIAIGSTMVSVYKDATVAQMYMELSDSVREEYEIID